MVFSGLYPVDTREYTSLRDALEKLTLNDASLAYEPEESAALGPGFRCGFLGLLHMDIVQERLEREYGLDLITTSPSVEYRVNLRNGELALVERPTDLPHGGEIESIEEPWLDLTVITPDTFIGAVMELVTEHRGRYSKMEYLNSGQGERGVGGAWKGVAGVPDAAGGDAGGVLRPAQVEDEGVCIAGLCVDGIRGCAARETGPAGERAAGGCVCR